MGDVKEELDRVGQRVRRRFDSENRVLSFREYLAHVQENPVRHTRDASRYVHDCLRHYGTEQVSRPWGQRTRWRIFDLAFSAEEDAAPEGQTARRRDHLIGHESVQEAFVRVIEGFSRGGVANRLVLFHGPNGSAKSTFTECLMRGLESYSAEDEGALYRFSWIFPRSGDAQSIGFSASNDAREYGGSYAHLPEDRVDVKLVSELREHPLLLLPLEDRRDFVTELFEQGGVVEPPPDSIWHGELGHKNRQVFEALLTAYRGDLDRVLAHVQVERYYISRRYRTGAVTIGPQMAVDAHERQITSDRSLNSLPASLSAVTLFECFGELVDGAGGLIEYSDLLKRPLDAWKYLLLAIETGEVSMPFSSLPLNSVLVASSNELHLRAFREHPEYHSFRGRMVPVRVPYLRDYRQEQEIYDARIVPQIRAHVAPHTTYVASLWSVLSRLRRADAARYDDPKLGRIAADLTPMEKAELYADGLIPRRLESEDAKTLREGVHHIYEERSGSTDYEGSSGASPREISALLLDAAADVSSECVSPLNVIERLQEFCRRDDYPFLRDEPDRGYRDHSAFVGQVRKRWLDRVDGEFRTCTGLVEETQYLELFERYVTHVSHWVKQEQIYNSVTSAYENPDAELMTSVEEKLDMGGSDADEFRRGLLSAVAAYSLDHPGQKFEYVTVFPRHIERLREASFAERHRQIATIGRDALAVLDEDPSIEDARRIKALETLDAIRTRYGYQDASVRVALSELVADRYS